MNLIRIRDVIELYQLFVFSEQLTSQEMGYIDDVLSLAFNHAAKLGWIEINPMNELHSLLGPNLSMKFHRKLRSALDANVQ
jgi:hypothetical protein